MLRNEGTIQHGDQSRLKKKGGEHRPTKHDGGDGAITSCSLPSGVTRRVRARLSTSGGSCVCVRAEMQAANDRTTKRCFPSAAQRPSNPTGHSTAAPAASLISALTCGRASCTLNQEGGRFPHPAPPQHHHNISNTHPELRFPKYLHVLF